jgi:hypothetical protein
MSLSLKAIDRIFERLTMTYGRDFTSKWEGVDQNAVKSSWSHELSCFNGALHMIGWGLENLPEKPPNVIQFRTLCRQAPHAEAKALEVPKADPDRMRTELEKLSVFKVSTIRTGNRDWAHAILRRLEDGAKISPTVVQMAKKALGAV